MNSPEKFQEAVHLAKELKQKLDSELGVDLLGDSAGNVKMWWYYQVSYELDGIPQEDWVEYLIKYSSQLRSTYDSLIAIAVGELRGRGNSQGP